LGALDLIDGEFALEDEDPGSTATTKSPWPTSRSRRSRVTSRARSQRWRLEPPLEAPDPHAGAGRYAWVHVEISEEIIELLEKRGYDPRRNDASIGLAVTAPLIGLGAGGGMTTPAGSPAAIK
jgi:hypothetical protein